jgi:chemotaxis protein CheX
MRLTDLDPTFINLFLDSVEMTFSKVFQSELCRGRLSAWKNNLEKNEIAVLTGVTGGNHTGVIVYSMKEQTAKRMVNHMDPGTSSSDQEEYFYGSLGEVVNILSGNTMTHFSKNRIDIDITTPSIVTGPSFNMYLLNQATLSADMLSPFGTIEINIAIKRCNRN